MEQKMPNFEKKFWKDLPKKPGPGSGPDSQDHENYLTAAGAGEKRKSGRIRIPGPGSQPSTDYRCQVNVKSKQN
jgi:hypothetical protein